MLFLINAHPSHPNMVATGMLFVVVVVWTIDRSHEKTWPRTQKIFVLKSRDFFDSILLLCVWPISTSRNKEGGGVNLGSCIVPCLQQRLNLCLLFSSSFPWNKYMSPCAM